MSLVHFSMSLARALAIPPLGFLLPCSLHGRQVLCLLHGAQHLWRRLVWACGDGQQLGRDVHHCPLLAPLHGPFGSPHWVRQQRAPMCAMWSTGCLMTALCVGRAASRPSQQVRIRLEPFLQVISWGSGVKLRHLPLRSGRALALDTSSADAAAATSNPTSPMPIPCRVSTQARSLPRAHPCPSPSSLSFMWTGETCKSFFLPTGLAWGGAPCSERMGLTWQAQSAGCCCM
jgi:hypothetical protein